MMRNSNDKKEQLSKFLHASEPLAAQETDSQQNNILEEVIPESVEKQALRLKIIEALKTVYDPEIPVNIYDLGLIYHIDIDDDNKVKIDLTLTTPGCPVAHTFPGMVQDAVAIVEGVVDVGVELVWDPPWNQEMMSDAAKLELGMF